MQNLKLVNLNLPLRLVSTEKFKNEKREPCNFLTLAYLSLYYITTFAILILW